VDFMVRTMAALGIQPDDIVMAHELTHALQDQHFDLKSLPLEQTDDDDLALASQCVVEGDAMLAMMAWTFHKRKSPADQVFSPLVAKAAIRSIDIKSLPGGKKLMTCPPYVRESLIFPYLAGLAFSFEVAGKTKSFAPLDEALRNPPRSTEQILHPEKLDGEKRDDPQTLTLTDLAPALGDGYRLYYTNVLGEFGCRILFENEPAAPKDETRSQARERKKAAETAAAGWDGDRFALYVKDGAPDVLVWISTWDTPEDADQAYQAYLALPSGSLSVHKGVDVYVFRGCRPADAISSYVAIVEKSTRVERKTAPRAERPK
jgi:hypothetical protein